MDLWIHWFHLMAAILWVGSLIFTTMVVQPVLRKQLTPESRFAVFREVGRRFVSIQWICWGILLLTGFYKLWDLRTTPDVFRGDFGKILGLKILFIVGMVVISLLHAYRWGPRLMGLNPKDEQYKVQVGKMAFWGKINMLFILAIVFCAALLRFNPW